MPRKKGDTNKTKSLRQDYLVEHETWVNALHRCHNPGNLAYRKYGARGLTVCDRWRHPTQGFANFVEDMGKRPAGDYSLERKNNNLGYSKANCEWADRTTQQNNLSERTPRGTFDVGYGCDRYGSPYMLYKGEVRTLAEWAARKKIKRATIRQRLQRGLSIEAALFNGNYKGETRTGMKLADLLLPPETPAAN